MEKNRSQRLTWEQKLAIIDELKKRQNQNVNCTLEKIGAWAKQQFYLQKITHRNTISRIKHEKNSLKDLWVKEICRENPLFVTSNSVETTITSWIWDMYERKVFISDELIQEKARRIQLLLNQQILEQN